MRSVFGAAILGTVTAACGSDETTSPTPTSTLTVTPARLVMGLGMSRQLSAAVVDESGAPVVGATVSFLSSNPGRASVTSEGLVSYVGIGETEIRASSDDLLAVVPYTGLRSGHPLVARPVTTLAGIGMTLLGVPVYLVWKAASRRETRVIP
jgi:hypothetical protein